MRNNPDIFWFSHQYNYDENSYTVFFQYTFSVDRIKLIQQSIEDVIKNDFCIEYVRSLPRLKQIAYVYKWLVKYCNYNVNSAYNQSIYSVFVRRNSVCTGYAKSAHYLFKLLGINSQLVFGRLNDDKEEGRHCWNIVEVENQYYHFDVCLGDITLDEVIQRSGEKSLIKIDGVNYNFLCISTDKILKTRSIEDIETLPLCRESLSQSRIEDLASMSIKQRDNFKGCLLTHIGSSSDVYLCAKDKNTVLKVFRYDSKTTCAEEYRYMQQMKGSIYSLQCNEEYTDINNNILAIEQSTPIVDLLCSHYYELTLRGLLKIAVDIAKAWKECKQRGVLYRDIHICNIYRSNDGIFKLGDFGSCTDYYCHVEDAVGEKVGNQWFMAPETYTIGKFDERSAIYAISMVMYFILNNLRPVFWQHGLDDLALRRRLDGEKLPLPISSKNFSSDIEDGLSDFFNRNTAFYPKERSANIDKFIFDIQTLFILFGNQDVIIPKGIHKDFDVFKKNKTQTGFNKDFITTDKSIEVIEDVERICLSISNTWEGTDAYDTTNHFYTEVNTKDSNIYDVDSDGSISDYDVFFVDKIEDFARTMGFALECCELDNIPYECLHRFDAVNYQTSIEERNNYSLKEYKTYISYCKPDSQLEHIDHSINELRYKISVENKLFAEQQNSIQENINEETAIIEILKKNSLGIDSIASGFVAGAPIGLCAVGSGLGGIIGRLIGSNTKNKVTSSVEEKIIEHQGKINKLKSELTHLQGKSNEQISILQNQLEKYVALKEDIMNTSKVYSSVFAPAEVKRKSHLMVQVYLHLYEETKMVQSLSIEADINAERKGYIPLQMKLKCGDKVDVEFNVYGETLLMTEYSSLIWQGNFTKCSFDYFVPSEIDVNDLSCKIILTVNGLPVGEMRFVTTIVDNPRKLFQEIFTHKYNKVFISYAHQDESTVQFLAEGFKIQSADYFFDRHYLKTGDVYPQKIQDYINSADLFILCWSENASKSEYVKKERMQALERAFPKVKPAELAKLSIYPISIEPRAELPADMKKNYNFGKM